MAPDFKEYPIKYRLLHALIRLTCSHFNSCYPGKNQSRGAAMTLGKSLLLTLCAFIIFQGPLRAETDADPLANISISKSEVAGSLDKLKKEGKISQKEYDEAKAALLGMSDDHLKAIKEVALGMARNDPDKALQLVKAPTIDLAEAEKQMQAINNP